MTVSLDYVEFWYEALRAEFGVVIETNNRDLFRQRLYAARRAAQDDDLEGISILWSPLNRVHLWLAKTEKLPDDTAGIKRKGLNDGPP